MQEQLISFNTAILAKEKGFNEECEFNYCTKTYVFPTGLNAIEGNIYRFRLGLIRNACAPTQSLLQKWLREKHNILVSIISGYTQEIKNDKLIYSFKPSIEVIKIIGNNIFHSNLKYEMFHDLEPMNYEEVLEIGLQKALKLIS